MCKLSEKSLKKVTHYTLLVTWKKSNLIM